MSKKSKRSMRSKNVEREFMDALDRLRMGRPRNPELAKLARLGKLRINYSTVSTEAGRSRTLIGTTNCRYPRVRLAIEEEMLPAQVTRTADDVIHRLRQENSKLKSQIRQANSLSLALLRQKDDLLRVLEDKDNGAGRVITLRQKARKNEN